MIDRLGKEVNFSELFMEETLSAKDKKTIPDDQCGLIIKNDKGEIVERKFPLNDETHVRQAAIFFDRAKGLSDDQKRELARNIVRRAKELDMDYSGWESLKPYLYKPVKESDDKRVNDKGETVPEKCDKCGSPIKVFLRGEPVYLCCNKDCRKYFGTVPCDIQEQYMTYEWLMKQNYPDPDSTSGTSDFDDPDKEPDDCYTESFEEMFGPVIQEAFDAITGEEIPINHAYTMDDMKKITFSESELKYIKHNDEMEHVDKIFFDECYFASPIDYGKSMTLNGPLFVTPYKAIASIFCGRDKVKENIPKIGTYNLGYKEWTDFKVPGANKNQINKPLREVHVYVEGYPFLESKTIEAEGFIHCINAKKYGNNFYKYPWMDKLDREYLIANTEDNKIEFTRTIKCKVRYIIEGKPARPGQDDLGTRPNGLTHWIHEIANKIHTKYKADQKEPIGNQNCLLCSWCAEAQIRGQDYLPRPVYSPRDPALEITPGDIVGGVTKKNPGSFNDMLNIIKKESSKQQFARWYCHVKWGHSNGGHEFLIVKIDENAFNIMDPQQGAVRPLTADDSYMKNIDWEGTYICRIDDKPFKYMKLDKINDPKKTLPWDPKKDIPYMVKHGLCTKEEAEKELKKAETNLFTSELKKALGQTPIQESHTDLLDETFYRFEYDGEGIYEALRKNMSVDDWKNFKQSKAATWLPVPPNYQTGDQSFFTKKGYDKFMNLTYPYMTKYLKKSKIHKFETELNPKYIRYRDEYQVVFNKTKTFQESTIQEGVWGDIRNGVNPWSMKRVFHISPEGHLDGQVFKPRVPEYLDKYDPSKTEFEDVETPRVCFSPSIEGCLNAILVNIARWKTANKLRDWYVYIPEKPLKEYKYRTNKQLIDEKKVYDANLTKEIWIEEPVRLKQYGIIRIDSVTDANRKKAVPTTLGESKKRNIYDFKWHWLVRPSVIKDLPYDYSPIAVCNNMEDDISGFKYGLGYDGSVHKGSSKDYDEKYRLESPEEFEKNGGGICYDFVEWQAGYLEAYGYTCRKFFISTDTEDMDTHTFILVDDGNGKFIYPEAAFKLLEGTHTVKFLDEAVDMIMKKVWDINDNKSKYDKIKYYFWEYKDHPPYGSDMKTCHEYFTKGEPIGEGMIKNPYKRKE